MRIYGKEIIEFCDEILKKTGKTVASMSRDLGVKKELFYMWRLKPELVPRIDIVASVSEYLGMTVSQLIGQESTAYSGEMLDIIKMLQTLSPTSIKAITAVVKTYYDMEIGGKTNSGEVAG